MRFEAFVLQVEIKPFLSTYKADSVLILLDVLLFLPQLWKLINDGAWKYLGQNLDSKNYIKYFTNYLCIEHIVNVVIRHCSEKSLSSLQSLIGDQ